MAHSSGYGKGEPNTAMLAGALTHQTIDWRQCDFSGIAISTEEVRQQLLATPGLACADITVPRDWLNPRDGNTITLRISRTATSSGRDRQGIALVNPGGPAGRGLHWGAGMARRAPELAEKFDFIGFDPRGVGDSTPLVCKFTARITADELPGLDYSNLINRTFGERCQKETPLAKYITTEQTAYDMDFIRVLLKQPRVSYFGYSYGTWLGTWYAATFPGKVHRMVLDSATDVSERSLQRTWDLQARSRERAFQQQMLPYVARHDDLYGLGTDPVAIRKAFEAAGGTRGFLNQLFVSLLVIPAMYDTSLYPSAAAALVVIIQLFGAGQPAVTDPATAVNAVVDRAMTQTGLTDEDRTVLAEARAEALAQLAEPASEPAPETTDYVDIPLEIDATLSAFEAIRCGDGQWNQNLKYWDAWQRDLERNAPFAAGFNLSPLPPEKFVYPVCAHWRTDNRIPRVDPRTFPKVLVLNSEMDAATAYEAALATAEYLPGARMISVDNEGSHGVFPYFTECVDEPVFDYFLRGRMPSHKFTACQGLPLPGESETYQVAGTITRSGKIKIRTVGDDVRRANRAFKHMFPSSDRSWGHDRRGRR